VFSFIVFKIFDINRGGCTMRLSLWRYIDKAL